MSGADGIVFFPLNCLQLQFKWFDVNATRALDPENGGISNLMLFAPLVHAVCGFYIRHRGATHLDVVRCTFNCARFFYTSICLQFVDCMIVEDSVVRVYVVCAGLTAF